MKYAFISNLTQVGIIAAVSVVVINGGAGTRCADNG